MTRPIKYLVIGSAGTLLYFLLVAAGLAIGVHYFLTIIIAEIIWMFAIFPLYRGIVFQSTGKLWSDVLRFLGVSIIGIAGSVVLVPIFVEIFGLHPLLSQAIVIVIIGLYSYFTHLLFTFRKKG